MRIGSVLNALPYSLQRLFEHPGNLWVKLLALAVLSDMDSLSESHLNCTGHSTSMTGDGIDARNYLGTSRKVNAGGFAERSSVSSSVSYMIRTSGWNVCS